MTGCDTTSTFYGFGKHKLAKIIADNDKLYSTIARGGLEIISYLYSSQKHRENLNKPRYLYFASNAFKKHTKLQTLSPTEGSAIQHSYRVYLQAQEWIGQTQEPTNWG